MKMSEKKWKFCYANHCWWVIIDSLEQFLEYKDKTNSKYGHALIKGIYGEENPYQQLYDAAEVMAKSYETSLVGGMSLLSFQMYEAQMNAVMAGNTLWFNDLGGYNYGLDSEKIATVYRDRLIFPNYTKKDIRISKWGNGGQHYYAKVGEIEVKTKDSKGETIMKWNTYDEAYEKALEYCSDGKDDN